jgi:hypothetical protein
MKHVKPIFSDFAKQIADQLLPGVHPHKVLPPTEWKALEFEITKLEKLLGEIGEKVQEEKGRIFNKNGIKKLRIAKAVDGDLRMQAMYIRHLRELRSVAHEARYNWVELQKYRATYHPEELQTMAEQLQKKFVRHS